ncbi:bifunctional [glutamine synthetase] adenylyltransferase/[glutamine synthetase]-adenylyl-L-tyrosine phosphorylase [Oceanibium sediminis]|uniref:bifunctional [glutamine synthetase] adenylyltransferase/[glutamine synthetase]-adenylyl-L-tyrosine phosphorylase n=1 Tax=Oceanibium sediminis TaxID=2026339 RepID=UPI000DD300F8|nr:bifunctional [glutamine synthetase] adenylyltransferase/[glutamine synthetase]-adenylyl-L-tyrosine phosphorylase [Oceanibium sediminis]
MTCPWPLTTFPLPHDQALGQEAAARFTGMGTAFESLVAGAAGSAPHLNRLITREADWLAGVATKPLEEGREDALTFVPDTGISSALRQAKRRVALLSALADLGGAWDLDQVTGILSDLADRALQAALSHLVGEAQAAGRLPPTEAANGGLFIIAMGKLGARELNYSSDIDLIVLFDESLYPAEDYPDVRKQFIRITQGLVKLMAAETGEGYVFRTDLRLRPDPSSTPVCIGMGAAERYYEAQGRTWERAAFIRARIVAGDHAAGERFLETLQPFIWRRHLDFAAIEDAHDMRRRIRDHKGLGGPFRLPGHNVKLGRGGIREIEFFIQTKQLICGGRDRSLRVARTLPALEALVQADWVPRDAADVLGPAYVAHRTLEHHIQMLEDAQTHRYPTSDEGRARIAALAGAPDRAAYESEQAARFGTVHELTESFFAPDDADRTGQNVWADLPDPEAAIAIAEGWARLPALKTPRGQALFGRLAPKVADRLSGAADPNHALTQFDRFVRALPAGVQVFSLFEANPQLLDLLIDVCATAPRLAEYLGRNAAVFDAVLAPGFFEPLPGAEVLGEELARRLERSDDYETCLDLTRIWAREQGFRIGVQLLRGIAAPREAGQGYAAVADAVLSALLPKVTRDHARRFGPPPGAGLAVLGMGKLGSAEMTARSDLDLIVVYDAPRDAMSEGRKSLAAPAYYARLTQALVAALTVATAEGSLYEVDMRLRPSGRQGPVATSLTAFAEYQKTEAWTWEHLALSRARVVTGDEPVCEALEKAVRDALVTPRDRDKVLQDVAQMRARIAAAKPDAVKDPWEVKEGPGRMLDIELWLQTGKILHPEVTAVAPVEMIAPLQDAGWLSAEEARVLEQGLNRLTAVQQIARLTVSGPLDPEAAGLGLQRLLLGATGAPDLQTLAAELADGAAAASEIISARLVQVA